MSFGRTRRAALAVAVVASALLVSGCAARWAHRQGQEESRRGNWDLAVARFTRALQKDPDNIGYKISLENARIQASRYHYDLARKHLAADDLDKAVEELTIASKYDPSNKSAADDLVIVRDRITRREEERTRLNSFEEVKARASSRSPLPVLSPRSGNPISLRWDNQSLQKLYETLGRLAGVNVIFDEGFRDKPFTVNLSGVTFQEALDQISLVTRNFYKVLDQNTVIVIPESSTKRRSYDDILLRTFYIQNAELKEIEAIVKTTLGPQARVASNPTLSALTILGTRDELGLADRVIHLNDKARGEVVLEIAILEVNRSKVREYGIALSNFQAGRAQAGVTFAPTAEPDTTSQVVRTRAHLLSSLNLSDFIVNIPSDLFARFFQSDSNSRVLAAPRLRAAEGKKTALKIGTEIAVPTTTFQIQQAGAQAATSFNVRNVGVNMEVTPRVNASGDITLELAVEFSLLGDPREVGGLTIDDVRTRNVNGIMRLRDGETTLMGGLVLGREARLLRGPLGLLDVPILNRVFGEHENEHEDNEILISITPHLVRAPKLTADDLAPLYIGTREMVRVPSVHSSVFGAEETTTSPSPSPSPATPPGTPEPAPGPSIGRPPGTVSPGLPRPGEQTTPAAPPTPYPQAIPTPLPPPLPTPAPPPPSPTPAPEGVPIPSPSPAAAPGPVGPVTASVSPAQLTVRPGEIGSLGVVVVGGRDLTAIDVVLSYDSAVVDATDVTAGPLLLLDGGAVGIERTIEPGRVRARLTRPTPAAGSGVVANVSFRGLRPGSTTVRVEAMSVTTSGGPAPATIGPAAQIVVGP
jgi:general secretion pathway protein D